MKVQAIVTMHLVRVYITKTIKPASMFLWHHIPKKVACLPWGLYCSGCLSKIEDSRPPHRHAPCECGVPIGASSEYRLLTPTRVINHVKCTGVISFDVSNFDVGSDWPPRKKDIDEEVILSRIRELFDESGQATPLGIKILGLQAAADHETLDQYQEQRRVMSALLRKYQR